MFTGLVEEVGTVRQMRPRGEGATLTVSASSVLEGLEIGESISIAGACQTVVSVEADGFTVEVVRETLRRTRFGSWKPGDRVNLERAMRPSDRLGGHIVQGHVDGVISLRSITPLPGSRRLSLELPPEGRPFVVEKGSVALDGISLTVAGVGENFFEVEIIPHTWENTTLRHLRPGDGVHVEWDLIAKYVRNMMSYPAAGGSLDAEALVRAGFGGRGKGGS